MVPLFLRRAARPTRSARVRVENTGGTDTFVGNGCGQIGAGPREGGRIPWSLEALGDLDRPTGNGGAAVARPFWTLMGGRAGYRCARSVTKPCRSVRARAGRSGRRENGTNGPSSGSQGADHELRSDGRAAGRSFLLTTDC